MGIIPDKFILLDVEEDSTIDKIKQNLMSEESIMKYEETQIDELAIRAHQEYKLRIKGVKEVCRGYINEVDGNKSEGFVLEDIVRELRLKRIETPKRPPRVFLMGPPGSGKQT